MLSKLMSIVVAAATGLGVLASPSRATAGTIYIDSATFFSAIDGLGILGVFSESFDTYATGSITPVPLSIGGGLGTISYGSAIELGGDTIGDDTGSADKYFLGNDLSFSLPGGVGGLGFYFRPDRGGGYWTFGSDISERFDARLVYFVGWIGEPGEILTSASYSDSQAELGVDDVIAYEIIPALEEVPEPTPLLLLGTGLAGAAVLRYRRRR